MSKTILTNLGLPVFVNEDDLPMVAEFSWHIHPGQHTWYARTNIEQQKTLMHQWLMGFVPFAGAVVDHINGDGWDNRRENLRWVTERQNRHNRRRRPLPFVGIRRRSDTEWLADGSARIYGNMLQAALAYDDRFGPANFPNRHCVGAVNRIVPLTSEVVTCRIS